jgi:uncharacterized protein (TIGR04141 family)
MVRHHLMRDLSTETLQETANLHALDGNHEKMQSWSIWRRLSGEVNIGNDTYILDDGALLSVATDFLRDINAFTNQIADAPQTFPPTHPAEREGPYNERISESLNGALLLDRKTVRRPQATDIEICDVVTKTKHLIHVKKGTSSSSLSHLFAQGVVSAELLHMEEDFRKAVGELLSNDLVGSGAP